MVEILEQDVRRVGLHEKGMLKRKKKRLGAIFSR
jgi:hypothetical protein